MRLMVFDDDEMTVPAVRSLVGARGGIVMGPFRCLDSVFEQIAEERPDAALLNYHLCRASSGRLDSILRALRIPFAWMCDMPGGLLREAEPMLLKPIRLGALAEVLAALEQERHVPLPRQWGEGAARLH